mgnify:CR=1 FL=1
MAATESTMLELGTAAPDFELPTPAGEIVPLADYSGSPGLVVAFICNHCPFVKLMREDLAEFAREDSARGVEMVAINSNDFVNYEGDSPEKMQDEINEFGYTFPYLVDENQEVAKAYRAACTPDFYLFDAEQKLVYRGRFDGATPGNGVDVTGEELRAAADALLAGSASSDDQIPSIGCNIKWKAGNEPDYY